MLVQMVEEKQEKPLVPPTPVRPKPRKVPVIVRAKPEPQALVPLKEEEPSPPPVLQATEEKIPQVLEVHEENMGVEEKPTEERTEKVEPGRWGNREGPQEAEPFRLGKEEPPMSLTEKSASAAEGVPGGRAGVSPWGKGIGGEAGFPGGFEGGKGTVPPKGEKTGSVYFQGEGKGGKDLASYLGMARMRIEEAKRYPRQARRKGCEGKVIISFQIDRKGEVGEIRLIQSCGHRELDEEAMATLRRASPFPSPLLIEKEKLDLEVPILFKLEEKK
jgi:protein TonB